VYSALTNVTDYYGKVKERNVLLRTSCNLAELSFRTMAFAASPLTSLAKKPILSVDSYLCDKVDELEHNYPSIVKPTDVLTTTAFTQAKEVYDKTLKQPIDVINNIKERTVAYGSDTMQSVVKKGTSSLDSVRLYSYEKMNNTADFGLRTVDCVLENKFAKLFTKPVVDLYEKSMQYLLPAASLDFIDQEQQQHLVDHQTTLRRIFDINNRVYKHLYQSTFAQLSALHLQFDNTIKKLQAIKDVIEYSYTDSKERIHTTLNKVSKNTLVSQCVAIIDKNKVSLEKIDGIAKHYSKALLTDVTHMLEKYMGLVKSFPAVFNGTKLKVTMDNIMSQINKDSIATFLSSTIDQLKKMNHTLMAYTSQMFQVVTNSVTEAAPDNAQPATEIKRLTNTAATSVATPQSSSGSTNSRQQQHHH
jgi:hypothetical protein